MEGLLALGLLVALSLGGVRCSAYRQGGDDARLAQLAENAHKASLASLGARRITDSVTKATDAVTRRVTSQVAANRQLSQRLSETLAANDSILSLAPDSVGEGVLRDQLAKTNQAVRLFQDSTKMLLNIVDVMMQTSVREREAWLAEREHNAIQLAAERQVSEHLRKQARCRVLGVPCLTRVQSGMVGAGSILLLLTLL